MHVRLGPPFGAHTATVPLHVAKGGVSRAHHDRFQTPLGSLCNRLLILNQPIRYRPG